MQPVYCDCFSLLSCSKSTASCQLFSRSLWETHSFLPKEISWPWAGFIWYEIYFTSQSMWYNPSGKLGLLSACLLRLPPPLSCTFPGNSYDENTERGNLSMYQICWEASESEVQLHRHREGENMSQKLQWERREWGTLLFPTQLFILSNRVEVVQCHYFLCF